MPNEIKEVDDMRKKMAMVAINLGTMLLCGIERTDEIAIISQLFIGLAQITVHIAYDIQMVFRQKDMTFSIGQRP